MSDILYGIALPNGASDERGTTMTLAREMIPVQRVSMRVLGKDMTNGNCVRAYRSDPEGITLQIRMDGRFVSTWLPFVDAKELADRILEEVNR